MFCEKMQRTNVVSHPVADHTRTLLARRVAGDGALAQRRRRSAAAEERESTADARGIRIEDAAKDGRCGFVAEDGAAPELGPEPDRLPVPDRETVDDSGVGLACVEADGATCLLAVDDGGQCSGFRAEDEVLAREVEIAIVGARVGPGSDEHRVT